MRERRERKWRGFTNQIDAATRDRRRPSSLFFFSYCSARILGRLVIVNAVDISN